MCYGLHSRLENNTYKQEIVDGITNLDMYYKTNIANRAEGLKYNKHTLPKLIDFLHSSLQKELEANKAKENFVILDRCIYEDYYIFAQYSYDLGTFKRFHNRRGIQSI